MGIQALLEVVIVVLRPGVSAGCRQDRTGWLNTTRCLCTHPWPAPFPGVLTAAQSSCTFYRSTSSLWSEPRQGCPWAKTCSKQKKRSWRPGGGVDSCAPRPECSLYASLWGHLTLWGSLLNTQTCCNITGKWVIKWIIWLRDASHFICLWKHKVNIIVIQVCIWLCPFLFVVHLPQLPENEEFLLIRFLYS